MNHEDRVFTLLIESNPIPEVETLDVDEVGGATYLATLEQRSSEMTELDTREQKPVEKKRSVVPWLVAAAAIVVLGVALVLINQGPDDAPAISQVTPSTIADAAPTTEQTPTTTLEPEVGTELSAVVAAEGWAGAVNEGDAEAALVFLHPDERERSTEVMAFFSAAFAGHFTNEGCAETSTGVECTLVIDDPLMVVLELDDKEFTADFVDGYLSIESVGVRMATLTAFSTYLFNYQPDSYELICSPLAVGATPLLDSTLAATADCGAVYLEFVADAAAWVNDGRPLP